MTSPPLAVSRVGRVLEGASQLCPQGLGAYCRGGEIVLSLRCRQTYAQMAESVDALVSNTNGRKFVPVRARLWVQHIRERPTTQQIVWWGAPFILARGEWGGEGFLVRRRLEAQRALGAPIEGIADGLLLGGECGDEARAEFLPQGEEGIAALLARAHAAGASAPVA